LKVVDDIEIKQHSRAKRGIIKELWPKYLVTKAIKDANKPDLESKT